MKPSQLHVAITAITLSFCIGQHTVFAAENKTAPAALATAPQPPSELVITDTQIGTGAKAVAGKEVTVHYTGWLYDAGASDFHGKKFDSSRDKATPFDFPLGAQRVIPGWDQGVAGMQVGGKRTLIIPSNLAYGKRGAGGIIPPNATLVFDIELLAVK